MGCKHEDVSLLRSEMAYCDDCKDQVWISDDDYVILDKAQYQLMQDAVKAGRALGLNLVEDEIEIARSDWGNTNANLILNLRTDLMNALVALDKGDNERGL